MVKRIVDTSFWTDMQVIDHYSVEDKYFYLYLMTNDKSTQVGIYPLPLKVISFETGYSLDVVQVLIERFSHQYHQIVYSNETQEVTLLHSLTFSVLSGGKPVSDLLVRELSNVKDGQLIQTTYEAMTDYWDLSKRKFDQSIKLLFENELSNRGLLIQNENQNQKQNESQNQIQIQNDNQSHNHNQESYSTTRGTIREDADETALLDRYAQYLKENHPTLTEAISPENILSVYYQQMIGDVHGHIENQFRAWEEKVPTSLILEALSRSLKANHPLAYAASIIENWVAAGVQTYKDVLKMDKAYNQ